MKPLLCSLHSSWDKGQTPRPHAAFQAWPQQVFTEQDNTVCFVFHFFSLTLNLHFWDLRSFTENNKEVTLLNKVTGKTCCCFAFGNVSLILSCLLPYGMGNPILELIVWFQCSPLSLHAVVSIYDQEHPQREFLQHSYSNPLQNGYFSKCPQADNFYFKSLPMGLCITQLTFESI